MQLMILEVSQKQNYIFASRLLLHNQLRSAQIAYVTGSDFFRVACPSYDEGKNLVYSGGGHTVLRFPDEPSATAFAKAVTARVLRDYPGMELYVKQLPCDQRKSPGENLLELSKALERKKSRRQQSFRALELGFEQPAPIHYDQSLAAYDAPQGWDWTTETQELAGEDYNFLAVVHIDGNSMGKRISELYDRCGNDWDKCIDLLQRFSRDIDRHFDEAFREMTELLAARLRPRDWNGGKLPLRRIISAGDDVCFITSGKLGMECAACFMERLSKKINGADGKAYSACAGVVLTYKTAPFRQSYDLSEALCSNAKHFVADRGGDFNALDFHIEYGTVKDSLYQTRQDYLTEDGCRLELRPLSLSEKTDSLRQYRQVKNQVRWLQRALDSRSVSGTKLRAVRTALHQGRQEAAAAARYLPGEGARLGDFVTDGEGVLRSRYYDAIELVEHMTFWREGER